MSHQHATIEDTVYFWFAANDTSGSGGDGATPLYDVREAGAAAGAIPLLSGTPTLLSHANYPAGCHEIAVAATTGNGFAADDTFAVFCTIAVDSQNPSGYVGSCTLTPLAKTSELDKVPKSDGSTSWNATALGAINAEADTAISDAALATASSLATAQTDLDTITGTDGVTLATAQALYAPNKVVPDAAGVAPTAVEIRTEIDSNSTQLAAIKGAGWTTETLTTIEAAINGQTDPSAALATIQAVTDLIPDAGAMTSIAQGSALTTAQADLDTITGSDGVTLATAQALYAPNVVVPDAAGTTPTLAQMLAGGDVDGFTIEESLKLLLAAATGVLAGAATSSITIKAADASKTRVTATVDADGNRTVVVRDATG